MPLKLEFRARSGGMGGYFRRDGAQGHLPKDQHLRIIQSDIGMSAVTTLEFLKPKAPEKPVGRFKRAIGWIKTRLTPQKWPK